MLGSAVYQPLVGIFLDKADCVDILVAQVFEPVAMLYLVTSTVGFIVAFFIKTKDDKLL